MINGNDSYNNKYSNKIERLLIENKDKNYLRNFVNFLGSKLSISTKYDYLFYVITFINYIKKEPKDLLLDDYTDFLSTLTNHVPSYQISVYSGIKKFSNYLFISGKTEKDYMQYISRPDPTEKQTTIEKREKGYLTKKEIHKLINSVENGYGSNKAIAKQHEWKSRDLLIILLMLNTGMRCSAIYKIDINNIDLDNCIIKVTEKRGKVQEYLFPELLKKYIYSWLNKRKELLENSDEVALFVSNQKRRMDQASIYRVVKKYSSVIENKNISPHKLRATYGTQLYEKTKDVYFVQSCMGHSNPKTTELYIRGQKDNNRKQASVIMSDIIF